MQNTASASGLHIVRQSSNVRKDGSKGAVLSFLSFTESEKTLKFNHVEINEEKIVGSSKVYFLVFVTRNPIPPGQEQRFTSIAALLEVIMLHLFYSGYVSYCNGVCINYSFVVIV